MRISGKEIESRRAEWESASDVPSSSTYSLGLATKLALFLFADIVVFFVFMGLATSGGGNAIGAGLVGVFLLAPAPFLVVAWIVAFAHSLLKEN